MDSEVNTGTLGYKPGGGIADESLLNDFGLALHGYADLAKVLFVEIDTGKSLPLTGVIYEQGGSVFFDDF